MFISRIAINFYLVAVEAFFAWKKIATLIVINIANIFNHLKIFNFFLEKCGNVVWERIFLTSSNLTHNMSFWYL